MESPGWTGCWRATSPVVSSSPAREKWCSSELLKWTQVLMTESGFLGVEEPNSGDWRAGNKETKSFYLNKKHKWCKEKKRNIKKKSQTAEIHNMKNTGNKMDQRMSRMVNSDQWGTEKQDNMWTERLTAHVWNKGSQTRNKTFKIKQEV